MDDISEYISESESDCDLAPVAPVAPRAGNTRSARGAAAVHWFTTVKYEEDRIGSNGSRFFDKLTKLGVKYIGQRERGEETGYDHLQVYLRLPKKQRLQWLKRHVHPTARFEVCHDFRNVAKYCCKEETRIAGPWMTIPLPRDIPAELRAELDKPLREWQHQLSEELLDPTTHPRRVIVYVDPVGNTGKSWFVKHFKWKHHNDRNVVCISTTRSADILTAIAEDTDIVFIDIPRCVSNNDAFPANAIEQIKNGMISQGKLQKEMQFVMTTGIKVVVFTNNDPDRNRLSSDRWDVRNFDPSVLRPYIEYDRIVRQPMILTTNSEDDVETTP